ncbi:MAG: hypothetical protein WKG32_09480, partial [Gemmatimonadaceae bacterium]
MLALESAQSERVRRTRLARIRALFAPPFCAALLAVAAASAAAMPLLAQAPPPPASDARLDARLDPRTRASVAAVLDSARAAGLPTEPLVDKALEGASKRADGAR